MPAHRGLAASLRLTALLLGCAAILPVSAKAVEPHRKPHHTTELPDLSDFDPGEDAQSELSRLAAEPGVVLKSSAPTVARRDGSLPTADDMPMPEMDTGLRTAEAPPSRSETAPGQDTGQPTGSLYPSPRLPGDVAPVQPSGSEAIPVANHDTGEQPVEAEAPVLDATTLQGVIEEWVDADPNRRKARQAIAAFYADRGFASLWVDEGRFDVAARALLSRIDHAAADGLDLRADPVVVPHGEMATALAASELSLSEAIVDYGRQASGGRVDPARIDPLVAAKPEVADPARVLASVAEAANPGEALRGFNPPHKGYALLRAKLAQLRQTSDMAERGPIPYGPALKPGMRDARVPLVRARFGLDIPASEAREDHLVYDTQVAGAVADYQRHHGLPASGVLTTRTVASLSGGNPKRLESEIVANMERWRWLPRDLGDTYVAVNIPDFSLDVVKGETVLHHARVVVGKPDHQTPVFSETMKFIIVNPYWNVPLSIVRKEMMPKLAADPNYFANHGYETVERNGETFVRQPPGDSNALGRIKFMFPNRFSVYLHDTNSRGLFARDERALSHGCVRVDQPFKLAEVILGRDRGWSEARIARMVGGDERTIMLPTPMPVHVNYFTAFVDDGGELRLRDDVYGYSAKVRAALGLDG